MNPNDLIEQYSIMIYEPPLIHSREDGTIRDLSNPLSVIMLIIDFDSEVSINGINNFLGNSTGRFAHEIVRALQIIGCDPEAAQLQQILDIAETAGMTREAIQQERSGLGLFAVTSFSELHGDKWDAACAEIDTIESEIDYSKISRHATKFVATHADVFEAAIGHAS
ncbi:DMP19 family protein [Rubinisphaera margarita]|uniref:DMP19 family protein n=1 Tax=Rubinisphaera margarita TaxID=2909586 RepID=UPI001EE7D973|nr:DUF4375 domain-containing protein [Rubinisphaera margarita]MCG6155038.1 DMP19 family protein [Rubinisphaera margarita]